MYETEMNFGKSLCLLISQSGASSDLLAAARAARKGGAYVVALVNVADSPLAGLVDEVLELHAGAETGVAATKSFIASLSAIVHMLSEWQQDDTLRNALAGAPELLHAARWWHSKAYSGN